MMELGISQKEARDGYRTVDESLRFVADDGTFNKNVVGMRLLADGRFVQNVMISFHELILALSLIHCSYDGLVFAAQQEKFDKLRLRATEYAARVLQVFARCKLAKRHLLRDVVHPGSKVAGPMTSWKSFHAKFGTHDSFDDCLMWIWIIDAACFALIESMKTCEAVKATTSVFQRSSNTELLEAEQQRQAEIEKRRLETAEQKRLKKSRSIDSTDHLSELVHEVFDPTDEEIDSELQLANLTATSEIGNLARKAANKTAQQEARETRRANKAAKKAAKRAKVCNSYMWKILSGFACVLPCCCTTRNNVLFSGSQTCTLVNAGELDCGCRFNRTRGIASRHPRPSVEC
eukprot:SAG11_NODE_394_length_9826_cov_3.333607_10_plen_348_part_00